MAFLRRASRIALVVVPVAAGCSLALDTDSLQKGSTAGTGNDADGMESGASDALDAPFCPEPGPDPCAQCQATFCCPQSSDCAHETRCNLAMVSLQQCRRDARLADNSRMAFVACNGAFLTNGGPRANAVLMCMASNCMASCGGV